MAKRQAIALTILLGGSTQIAHSCPWCADRFESRNRLSTEEIPTATPPKPFTGSFRIVMRDLVSRAEWTEISSEKKYVAPKKLVGFECSVQLVNGEELDVSCSRAGEHAFSVSVDCRTEPYEQTLYGKDKHGMSVFSATVSCQ